MPLTEKMWNMNIKGDIKGDGFQNGGAVVIAKGGNVLLEYVQEDPADHVSEEEVLKALHI